MVCLCSLCVDNPTLPVNCPVRHVSCLLLTYVQSLPHHSRTHTHTHTHTHTECCTHAQASHTHTTELRVHWMSVSSLSHRPLF